MRVNWCEFLRKHFLEISSGYFQSIPLKLFTKRSNNPRPIIVIPAFSAGRLSTSLLRSVLSKQGHFVYDWGLGKNTGTNAHRQSAMRQFIKEVSALHNRPVTLVGVSLGGIYAKYLSFVEKKYVEQYITICSPIYADFTLSPLGSNFRKFNDGFETDSHYREITKYSRSKPVVKTICIVSTKDEFVPKIYSREAISDLSSIRYIDSKHATAAHNMKLFRILLEEFSK